MSCEPLLGGSQPSPEAWEQNVVVLHLKSPPSRRRQTYEHLFWLATPALLGIALGLLLPAPRSLPDPFDRISSVIGWVYFTAWSISFYPQAILNYRRKSVAGLSLDFQLLNMLGFSCYAVYNAALYWSPVVRKEYACLNGGNMPAVHANDVFFALHAAVVTAFTLGQCCVYDRGGQRISWPAALATGASLSTVVAYLSAVVGAAAQAPGSLGHLSPAADGLGRIVPCGNILSWLSFLYFLSYIKLAVSLVKYIPQVYLNYSRKSTEGWNIDNIMLDFSGGLLSLAQQLMDSIMHACWAAITGNPVKFALGFASMFFDIIFMAQHWCLYPAGGLQSAEEWVGKGEGAAAGGGQKAPPALPHSQRSSPRSGRSLAAAPAGVLPGSSGSKGGAGTASSGEIAPVLDAEGADLEAGASGSSDGGISSSDAPVVAADHALLLR